ncbi:GTPase CgtA [Platysternon megacephalum]|uniref:GTPase CgtA n=1 Tax=Platysternon megacephalum TaxID=55544 RepID=A0A4D9DJP1_9SAUR|nr:GTPase CgtA [Platysternon megacephalum]
MLIKRASKVTQLSSRQQICVFAVRKFCHRAVVKAADTILTSNGSMIISETMLTKTSMSAFAMYEIKTAVDLYDMLGDFRMSIVYRLPKSPKRVMRVFEEGRTKY